LVVQAARNQWWAEPGPFRKLGSWGDCRSGLLFALLAVLVPVPIRGMEAGTGLLVCCVSGEYHRNGGIRPAIFNFPPLKGKFQRNVTPGSFLIAPARSDALTETENIVESAGGANSVHRISNLGRIFVTQEWKNPETTSEGMR